MRFSKHFWLAVALGLGGCGLYESPQELELCGSPCGPCDLGRYDCAADACGMGDFDPALTGSDRCDAVVFGREGGSGDGSLSSPVGTLQEAIDLAAKRGARAVVYSGNSSGPIEISDGVSVIAGRDSQFVERSNQTQIEAVFGEVDQGVCLNAQNIIAPTVIDGLACKSSGDAQVLVGARFMTVNNLSVRRCIFEAGVGRDGSSGQDAQSGAAGLDGANAADGADGGQGRSGGRGLCANSGGEGGDGAAISNGIRQEFASDGGDGEGADGGAGGFVDIDGVAGRPGRAGLVGDLGNLHLSSGVLVPELPQQSENGLPGGGGGGGGGGESAGDGNGGGGGGGGGGGCGGLAGEAGGTGGSSVGVIQADSVISFHQVTAKSNTGGAGGFGGGGGLGGVAGRGGLGGEGSAGGKAGGRGGAGGVGGRGGPGADGAGGHSIGVVLCESNFEESSLTISVGNAGNSPGGNPGVSQKTWRCTK